MKPTNTVAKLFSSVSTLAVVAGAMAFNSVAWGQETSVLAWGYNGNGNCTIPASASSGVSAIAVGWSHTIALKNGAVLAWGSNGSGQCTIPATASSGVIAIACGELHTVALKNGAVLAWGKGTQDITGGGSFGGEFGQCIIPTAALSGVSAIAGGGYHTMALKNGAVLAWGAGKTDLPGGGESTFEHGQCMIPATAQSGVTAIAGGREHTIALKGGAVLAWGRNYEGQCTIPAAALSGVIAIGGGAFHAIALKGPIATITGVLPISGPSSGNTNITITGTQFEAAATVTIGGAPATNVVVVSDTQITATTPAGFPGPAVVTVGLGSSTAFYYRPSCGSDLDNNGVVDSADLGIVLLDFGNCYESAVDAPQEPMIFPIEAAKPAAVKK